MHTIMVTMEHMESMERVYRIFYTRQDRKSLRTSGEEKERKILELDLEKSLERVICKEIKHEQSDDRKSNTVNKVLVDMDITEKDINEMDTILMV